MTLTEEAALHGMTVECWKLQRKLSRLPLIPLDSRLRKQRDRVTAQLLAQARKDSCVSRVNLTAGRI